MFFQLCKALKKPNINYLWGFKVSSAKKKTPFYNASDMADIIAYFTGRPKGFWVFKVRSIVETYKQI